MGVRVCHPFVSGAEGVIARPSAPSQQLCASQWLQTTDAADREWLSQQEHGPAVPLGASPCDTPPALPPAPQPEPTTKIGKRWLGLQMECSKALKSFGTEGWEKCKELLIGNLQKKVSGLQNEAASVGEAATLYDDMAKYSEGLTFGKHFVKAYREYSRYLLPTHTSHPHIPPAF